MRGRLYPQPRERYERFRLNPYSPLYESLALFMSASLIESILPELHGPYALPGVSLSFDVYRLINRFFPEIGRAAYSPTSGTRGPVWSFVSIPPQEVLTLTTMFRATARRSARFAVLEPGANGACLAEYDDTGCPLYVWRNADGTQGQGFSEGKSWPLYTWITYSATFRPGSVRGYLSNWGIIDVELLSGPWPNRLRALQVLKIAASLVETFVSDTLVHLRELSLTELEAISDYGNVDLRVPGEAPLILPVRTYWPSVLPVAPSYLKRRSLGVRVGTRESAL